MRLKREYTPLGCGLGIRGTVAKERVSEIPAEVRLCAQVIDPHSTYMRLWDFILAA